jgi:hypothetical protein
MDFGVSDRELEPDHVFAGLGIAPSARPAQPAPPKYPDKSFKYPAEVVR